jgi:hypothetical protein
MATIISYHLGGFQQAAPAQNKAEQLDSGTATYKRWDTNGVQLESRSLTGAESARLATEDALSLAATNESTIRSRAAAALTTNGTFLALASPTAAQVATQMKAVTRQCNGLIRELLGQLATITDT